jgi:hypothetical protein
MSADQYKKEAIAFFQQAITNWQNLVKLLKHINDHKNSTFYSPSKDVREANGILAWFQNNYVLNKKHSDFKQFTVEKGKKIDYDPIYNVVFGGANALNIINNLGAFKNDLNRGTASLRGHLASVEIMETPKNKEEAENPLFRIRKILSRFHIFADQLERVRKGKTKYLIEDEYDVQNLVYALLKIDFDDVRKEDPSPICAGSSSRVDLVLKQEKVLIEIKKTSSNVTEKELGSQLIEDITRYKEYPKANTLICFIYDPEHWIENPSGLKNDLEKQSTPKFIVEVIISN